MSVSANPRFDELKTTGKLPSPSGVALAIIELCRKDGVSIEEIAHAVRADPALSGRIISFERLVHQADEANARRATGHLGRPDPVAPGRKLFALRWHLFASSA